MVENMDKNDNDKFKELISRLDRISVKNLELEITRKEFATDFDQMADGQKIGSILCQGDDALLKWHLDEYKNKPIKELNYNEWKEKAIESLCKTTTLREFLISKQGMDETACDFFKKMKSQGSQLKLKDEIIMEIAKKGLRKNKAEIRLAICGEKRLTKVVLDKIKEADDIGNEQYNARNKKKEKREKGPAYSHRNNKNEKQHVNVVETEDLLNKDNYLYIESKKVYALFDTGAEENYISKKVVETFKIHTYKLGQVRERYTCLNEKFYIKECTKITFKYQNIEYEEIFYILPKRKDRFIIMGRKWLKKANKGNKDNHKNSDTIEAWIEKLTRVKKDNIPGVECRIKTEEGKCVVDKQYKLPQAYEGKVEREVSRLLELKYIRPSQSSWLNNVRPVLKPDGSIRLTTNLIRLNKLVELDKYSLPVVEEILYKLKNMEWFTKIDLKEGFFQIPINNSDCHKTAFRIKNRLYEWTRMPMGFKNSAAIFQRAMDNILGKYIGICCYVYVDDILIFAKTKHEHDAAVKKIIETLVKHNITENKDKIVYAVQEVKFLGHIIKKDVILPCIDNKDTIVNYPTPKNSDEIKSFLGIVNYYRKFIRHCATIQEPLLKLTRKNVEYIWDETCECAFQQLKSELLGENVLQQPDFTKDFILETDASNVGIGAILSQKFDGNTLPVAYASRKMGPAERNYSISEKEMLAALWAMEHFKYFLLGREFILITDHQALKALDDRGTLRSPRIERWIERIQVFSFTVQYKKGTEIPHVDGLSRIPHEKEINMLSLSNDTEQKKRILKFHKHIVHRGARITCEEYNKANSDKVSYELVKEVLRNCIECKLYNPIRVNKPHYINCYDIGEKVGFDIIGPYEDKYIITAMDYFSRYGFAEVITSRHTKNIIKFLKRVNKNIKIKMIICDSAKENISKEVSEWCKENSIERHTTSPHHHQSNGRIERFNRTILEGVNKQDQKHSLKKRVSNVIEVYNNVKHCSIGLTPTDARKEAYKTIVKQAQFNNSLKYKKQRDKDRKVIKYIIGNDVAIKNEIHKYKGQPKFNRLGKIKECKGQDTYLVELYNGKTIKRHSDQLRMWIKEVY